MTTGQPGKTDDRWERLQDLFSRAVELPEAEREAFVCTQSGDDAELKNELLELLACDVGRSTGPLTHALGAAIDATTRDRRKALVGKVVGNYKLVSILGHGGTGTVYLGERADRQYSAQVAVKIVDNATIHGDLGLRFRAERQILASLNHANIARLLDAGETGDGQPFLVMEYVHGEPVDRYCDREQLDLTARLNLFLEICNAVQYAHQNLIVHRDLKPANILVTAEGSPKLLDFGIAKLLDTGDQAAMLALTRMNDRLLTPEYASPEQILGRQVTTASDVYALGVVLYELLTGLRPYTVPSSASQLELERSICISDPQRPSTAVKKAMDAAATGESPIGGISLARGLQPDRLQRRLLGDIDSIVMRALRKEPQHRYGSVEQLTADVRRYLSAEPVVARQGNWLYYSQRFVRRHTFGVSAGVFFMMVIVAFAVAMSVQNQRIAAERDKAANEGKSAQAVSEFMLGVFDAAEPFSAQGKEITAKQLLEQSGLRVRGDKGMRPEVRARLLASIGRAFRRSGDPERSLSYLEDAVHLRRQMPNGGGLTAAEDMSEMAVTLRTLGDTKGSAKILEEAMQLCERIGGQNTPTYATLLTNRGRVEFASGDVTRSRQSFEQSLALNRQLRGPNDQEVAVVLLDLSLVFMWMDDIPSVERVTRQAVDIFRLTANALHPDRVLAETRLGEALLMQNQINEAGQLFESTLESQRTLFGNNSRQVAEVLDSLAQIRRAQGQLAESEQFAADSLSSAVNAMGAEHAYTPYFRTAYASVLMRRGKYSDAERELRHSLDTLAKTRPADHQYVCSAEHLLGEVLLETNRLTDAEAMLTAAMNRWKRTDAPAWRSARSASALGEVLFKQGRMREAESYLTRAYTELAADDSADRDVRIKARQRIEHFYVANGQREKLNELMLATSSAPNNSPQARPN
ncbi:serine/threonine-protein kinase [Steroidobacter sp.]|uniref:serine/threonine-protein kinase n=1 Tax=Steroidobacter sp. TaxID=1978227 RepID=UPI001A51CDEF|nr:serine/threonine-protein kinase [Steroidobacter sp.]MBL8271486.1 serine/threonine protein kinase [Steroidobacter sp.]